MTHPEDPRGPKDLPKYITGGTISEATRKKIVDYVVSRGIPDIVYQKDVTKDLNMDPGWANRALYHTGFRPGKAKNSKIGRPWYTPQDLVDLRQPEASDVEVPVEPKPTLVHDPVVGEEPKPDAKIIIGPIDPVLEEALAQIEDDDEEDLTTPDPIEDITPEESAAHNEAMNPTRDEAEVDRLKGLAQNSVVEQIIEREFIDSHESWVVEPEKLFGSKFASFMRDELRILDALGIDFEIRVWRRDS